MHPRNKLLTCFLFDVCATLFASSFVWFWTEFYYTDMRPPDLSGIPHSVPQLRREFLYISLWCVGFASIAAVANVMIVGRMGRVLSFTPEKAKRIAISSAVLHWVLVFVPTFWPSYGHWVLHTTYNQELQPSNSATLLPPTAHSLRFGCSLQANLKRFDTPVEPTFLPQPPDLKESSRAAFSNNFVMLAIDGANQEEDGKFKLFFLKKQAEVQIVILRVRGRSLVL